VIAADIFADCFVYLHWRLLDRRISHWKIVQVWNHYIRVLSTTLC